MYRYLASLTAGKTAQLTIHCLLLIPMQSLKKITLLLLLPPYFLTAMTQQKDQQAIRDVEQREVEALLKADTLTLFEQIWSPSLIVNNPANIVVDRQQIAALMKAGKIDYAAFERIIEKISIIGNTAIVMGREELKPEGVTDHAGKVVIRRFTNIWMKHKDNWRLVGRQATIASIQ
jgi:ketosteroid isomerase-like protein